MESLAQIHIAPSDAAFCLICTVLNDALKRLRPFAVVHSATTMGELCKQSGAPKCPSQLLGAAHGIQRVVVAVLQQHGMPVAAHAIAQELNVLQALYNQLLPRLQFRSDLPQDVMLKIHGAVGKAWHRTGCVCRSWRESIKRARDLGYFAKKVKTVSAGEHHSAAVTEEGSVFTWGKVGPINHAQDQLTPRRVDALEGKKVVGVAAGGRHKVAWTESGELWSWGFAGVGATGHGVSIAFLRTPRPVQDMVGKKVVAVAAGRSYTAVVTDSGELWTFGLNHCGECGLGHIRTQLQPQRVTALEGTRVVAVSCGDVHTMALTATGEVYSWGEGDRGRLGHGSEEDERIPRKVEALQQVAGITAGGWHSAAWSTSWSTYGAVWTWGAGTYGQLGYADRDSQLVPRMVEALAATKVVGVASGRIHTAAWTATGELLTWGGNSAGQLGHGNYYDSHDNWLPRVVRGLEGHSVVQASAYDHTIVRTKDGSCTKTFAFGCCKYGVLGASISGRGRAGHPPIEVEAWDTKEGKKKRKGSE